MKKMIDLKLIGGILFACLLINVSFAKKDVFWYLYTASMLFLISYSIMNEHIDSKLRAVKYIKHAIWTGTALYLLFLGGHWTLSFLPGTLDQQVARLYQYFSLKEAWHYLVLIFIIVPGEEIFWRGFIQKRLSQRFSPAIAVIGASILNGGAYFFTGYPILVLAGLASGLVWGCLYAWKKSMPLVILSHLIFNVLLFMLFPLT